MGDATANYPGAASVRRFFIALDNRVFLVVDDVRMETPAAIEARVHSFVAPTRGEGMWEIRDGEAALALSHWSGSPIEVNLLEDPGKEKKSMAIKPDWVIAAATTEPSSKSILATLLEPHRAGGAVEPLTAKRGEKEIVFHAVGFDIRFIADGDGIAFDSVSAPK
ncbi:MAG: hypothetical protein A2Z34_00355 [Planctomycetes bacterium RBG_16_59_8]|nr:MAG: hypothetical protein A2Z34_00355 [Planctomycetes bacterium RBG_16_59_8]